MQNTVLIMYELGAKYDKFDGPDCKHIVQIFTYFKLNF